MKKSGRRTRKSKEDTVPTEVTVSKKQKVSFVVESFFIGCRERRKHPLWTCNL
jgi:hypothetical protein